MTNHPINPDPIEQGVSRHESAEAGENLRQVVDRVGPLPWALVRWFALQISELLEPLHAKGLVHGEISPEVIHLSLPWPDHEVILIKGNSAPGSANDDLRLLGETVEWLLSSGGNQGDDLAGRNPEVERIISALADGSIPDAQSLSAILLDSLPDENDAPEAIHESSRGSAFERRFTLLGRKPMPWKIAAAAAVAMLVGAGSYFMFKPGSKNTAGRIEEAQSPADRTREPHSPSNASTNQTQSSEENAKELAAKEAAAKELVAKELVAKELVAKELAAKELAAKELAAKEQAAKEQAAKELAAKEQAAMEAAHEKAMKEKEIQDNALVSKNEKIIEDSEASPEEKEKAFSVLLSLAREENINAIELCGASYWQGQGVPKDREMARIWFEKGASLGIARSMLGLGYCYDRAIGGPRDMPKAVEWWTKAADLGYEVAMSRLGDHFYLNPDAKNMGKAMQWWQKAAEAKSPSTDAMTNLGIIYAKGIETGKDLQKAMKWWQMAADLGSPEAMTELGIVYLNGEIEGRESDAFPLFLKAAEAGSLRAMYGLEVCFREGMGTGKDQTEADRWGRIASEKEKEQADRLRQKPEDSDQ